MTRDALGRPRSSRARQLLAFIVLAAALSAFLVAVAAGERSPAGSGSAIGVGGTNPGMPERAGVIVRVPPGWHRVRGPRTHVIDPVLALAVASFPARSTSTCGCGAPELREFPGNGAFVLIWEWPHPDTAALAQTRPRPDAFRILGFRKHRYECGYPSWVGDFRQAGRVFQVEVYLGPATGLKARNRVEALLDRSRLRRTYVG